MEWQWQWTGAVGVIDVALVVFALGAAAGACAAKVPSVWRLVRGGDRGAVWLLAGLGACGLACGLVAARTLHLAGAASGVW